MLPICTMSYLMLERTAKEMVHVTGISSVTAVNGAACKARHCVIGCSLESGFSEKAIFSTCIASSTLKLGFKHSS